MENFALEITTDIKGYRTLVPALKDFTTHQCKANGRWTPELGGEDPTTLELMLRAVLSLPPQGMGKEWDSHQALTALMSLHVHIYKRAIISTNKTSPQEQQMATGSGSQIQTGESLLKSQRQCNRVGLLPTSGGCEAWSFHEGRPPHTRCWHHF